MASYDTIGTSERHNRQDSFSNSRNMTGDPDNQKIWGPGMAFEDDQQPIMYAHDDDTSQQDDDEIDSHPYTDGSSPPIAPDAHDDEDGPHHAYAGLQTSGMDGIRTLFIVITIMAIVYFFYVESTERKTEHFARMTGGGGFAWKWKKSAAVAYSLAGLYLGMHGGATVDLRSEDHDEHLKNKHGKLIRQVSTPATVLLVGAIMYEAWKRKVSSEGAALVSVVALVYALSNGTVAPIHSDDKKGGRAIAIKTD